MVKSASVHTWPGVGEQVTTSYSGSPAADRACPKSRCTIPSSMGSRPCRTSTATRCRSGNEKTAMARSLHISEFRPELTADRHRFCPHGSGCAPVGRIRSCRSHSQPLSDSEADPGGARSHRGTSPSWRSDPLRSDPFSMRQLTAVSLTADCGSADLGECAVRRSG